MKKIILHILTAAILFSMATLFVSAEAEVTLESFATVMPNQGKAGTVNVGEQIFTDRTKHFFGKDTPDWLLGQSFLFGSLVEGNTVTVTEDGFVYVITPVSTTTNSQATVLLANGFTETASIDSYKIATTISEPLTVLGKAVKAGDTVTFGKWGILLANINTGVTLKMTVGKTEYTVNGEVKMMDVAPIIVSSRTMLPVRYVAEALGATVVWDGDTSTATITTAGTELKITVGASEAVVNGQAVRLDSPAFIENSRTYMPVRFVAETLGATVAWDGATSTATITK